MGRPPTINRERLLETARRVFAAKGFEAATLADIAAELHVRRAAACASSPTTSAAPPRPACCTSKNRAPPPSSSWARCSRTSSFTTSSTSRRSRIRWTTTSTPSSTSGPTEPLEVPVPEARKLLPRVALVLVLATLVVATLVWWRAQRQPKEIVLSGTLEARTVEVGSLTGGRVVRVLVDEGQHVAAGQLIVQLETTTIDRQLDEQRAAIEAAKANLAKALAGPRSEEIAQAAAVAANDERDRHRLQVL